MAVCRHRRGNRGTRHGAVFRLARCPGQAGLGQGCAAALCRQPRTPGGAAGRRHRRRRPRGRLPLRSAGETKEDNMPIEILMPALSPTMTEGNLARWVKKEGDAVHSGDVLAEIETDKATMGVEAVDDGRVGKILVPEGTQGVKVNQPIALLLGEGEDPAALATFAAPTAKPAPIAAAGVTEPQAVAAVSVAAPVAAGHNGDGRIFASPLARRMALQAGLDLAVITGSGPQGRIVKADIDAALSGRSAPAVV